MTKRSLALLNSFLSFRLTCKQVEVGLFFSIGEIVTLTDVASAKDWVGCADLAAHFSDSDKEDGARDEPSVVS